MTMLQLEIRQQLRIFKSIGLKRVPSKFFYSCSIQNRVLSLRVLPNVPSRVAISPFQIRSHKLTQWENFNRYRKYSRLPKSPFLLGLIAVSVGEDKNDAEHTRNSDDVANDVATREGDLENVGEDSLDDCSLTGLETFLEPILTCFRFFQLTLLFLPVILSFPLILFGPKMSALRSERRGALLWYKYLTWTMEIAGPSFIKWQKNKNKNGRSNRRPKQTTYIICISPSNGVFFDNSNKLGQWAASRTDIFSELLCHEMSKLHSSSSPHSYEKTVKILEHNFNLKFNEIFDEFVREPLGVGAMGQVYKAKLSKKIIENAEKEPILSTKRHDLRLRKRLQQRMKSSIVERFGSRYQEPPSDWVVVKVLHPRVHKMVRRDLSIMRFFANLINAMPNMEWLSFPQEVDMFGRMMNMQLNLRLEAENLLIFRENFKERVDIHFPKPFFRLSSKDVLVEEYINGISMSTLLKNCPNNSTTDTKMKLDINKDVEVDKNAMEREISDKGLDAFLKMLLLDNFIHSDLHPGNIYIRFYKKDGPDLLRLDSSDPDVSSELDTVTDHLNLLKDDKEAWNNELQRLYTQGYKPQICFIDAGLVTELDNTNRRNFIELFKAIATFDGYHVGELMIERSRTPSTVINEDIFIFKADRLIRTIKTRTFALGNVQIGDLLTRMLKMVRDHHVRLEGDFITVIISVLLLEGIGRQLNPSMDLFKSSIPILRQLGPDSTHDIFNEDTISMAKVWFTLELRRFISASIQDVHSLVKHDGLCPNQ